MVDLRAKKKKTKKPKGYFPGHIFIFTEAVATHPQGHKVFWTLGTVPVAVRSGSGRCMPFFSVPVIKEN